MRVALYNTQKEVSMNDLSKIQVGDKFTSRGGKIIQIKKTARMKDETTGDIIDGFFVEVMATGKDVFVKNEYIQLYVKPLSAPVVAQIVAPPVEKLTEVPIPESEVKPEPVKMRVTVASLPPIEELKPNFVAVAKEMAFVSPTVMVAEALPEMLKNIEVPEQVEHKPKHREGTQRSIILDLLKKGPHGRKELAKALIDSKLTKSDDVNKVAFNVSIIVKNLEKEGFLVKTVSRGIYVIE
jgi:hypothetical protein